MCGIAGTFHPDGRPVLAERLARACTAMRHRGPDHTGTWIEPRAGGGGDGVGTIGLAAVRLAVQDPHPHAHQPMCDAAGRGVLVYNGEIYNADELRADLRALGRFFQTSGDTEVVLLACLQWGVDALERFNGMWALAFWDREARRGFVARDRFGIKPLVYADEAGAFHFASELGALGALGDWDRTVDTAALIQHVQFGYIAHPHTIYRGARRLTPGCYLPFGQTRVGTEQRYYDLAQAVRDRVNTTKTDWRAAPSPTRLRRLIGQAVVRRRVADVPVGAFLSGGLDSTIVVAHLAQASPMPIKTFSIGLADDPNYDESRYARLAAERFRTDHHEWKLTRGDLVDTVGDVLNTLDEPVGDSSIVPTALVSRLARQDVTVCLSGDGADELFGGYWRYIAHDALRAYQTLPRPLRRLVVEPIARRATSAKSGAVSDRVRQFRKLLRGAARDVLARHIAWARILAPEAQDIYTDPNTAQRGDAAAHTWAKRLSAGFGDGDDLTSVLAFDAQSSLPADMLNKVDRASMRCSLEVRVPFLDHSVAETALAIPSRFKIAAGRGKRILVEAYRGVLPEPILDRPKRGFEMPFGELIRGPLLGLFRDTVTQRCLESVGPLRYEGVERVLQAHLDRRGEHADLLFALLTLCGWQNRQT